MAKQTIIENDPGGYYLESNAGWFSVIEPKEQNNLILDPDFVRRTTYESFGGGALISGGNGLVTPTSGKFIASNIDSHGVRTKSEISLDSGEITFSVYARSLEGSGKIRLSLGNQFINTFTITGNFERYSITANFKSNHSLKPSLYSDGDIETVGWQLEYGDLTTYISGNIETCSWLGPANASQSYRPKSDWTGGTDVVLLEHGFTVTEIEGLGVPDLEPIIQNIALSDYDIYLASNVEAREISISGQLVGRSYDDLMRNHGRLVQLLAHKNRPSRIIFHPYICNDRHRCAKFDFIYTGGLNETVDRFYMQEVSLEGISNTPCIYGCDTEYEFVTVNTEQYFFEDDLYHIIYEDGSAESTVISPYGRCKVTAVASKNNNTYVVTNEQALSPYSSAVYRFISENNTWELIAGVTSGIIEDIEIAENLVLIGGEWEGQNFKNVVGSIASTIPHSFAIYNVDIKIWNMLPSADNDDFTAKGFRIGTDPGLVRTICYNEFDQSLHIGGEFDNVGGVYSIINYYAVYLHNASKIYGNIIPRPNPGTNDPGGPIGSVWSIVADRFGNVYIGGDFVDDDGPSNPHGLVPDVGNSDPNVFMYYDQARNLYQTTSFPFQYGGGSPFDVRISRLFIYNDVVFANGTMSMASNHYNNPPSSPGDNFQSRVYLAAVAWFDPTGDIERNIYAQNRGAWLPLGATLPTSTNLRVANNDETIAYGLFRTDDPYTGYQTPADRLDDLDVRDSLLTFSTFDGNLIMSAFELVAYGASNDKKPACGFSEFIFAKGTSPSGGKFLPPSFWTGSPVLRCSGQHFNIDSPNIVGMVANLSVLGFDEQLYINTGINVEGCANLAPKDVVVFVENGLDNFAGVINVTTGKKIIFDEINLTKAMHKIYYENQKIKIETGSYTITPKMSLNTGNPFEFVEGENRIKLLFSLPENLDTEITVRYKPCYISYSEICRCENDN